MADVTSDATPHDVFGQTREPSRTARSKKDDNYDRVIPALDPDIIVVMNRGYEEA